MGVLCYCISMTTVIVYSPKHHSAYHNADRDVIDHAIQAEKFVSVECDGYWNFYIDSVPTDKATFCTLLGKQIADNGSEYTTSDNSDWPLGFRAVAVGCQYYRNTHYKVTKLNSAGALFAFVTNHTDTKGDQFMTKNFELLKKLMKSAKEDAFLTPQELSEGVYEATLSGIAENDKRTVFVFTLSQGGKVGMSFNNDETGLGFLAQTLVRLGVSADMPTFKGLEGTRVVLNIKHDDSGEYIRAKIAAVIGNPLAVKAPSSKAVSPVATAPAADEVVEEVSDEFDLAAVSEGDVLLVQFGDEQKTGTLVSVVDDTYTVTMDDGDYEFTADMILGAAPVEEVVEEAPVTKRAAPQKKAAPQTKPAVSKASAPAKKSAPKMKHNVGDNVVVDIGDGKKYRSKITGIEAGQYLAAVKGQDYLLTDDNIVG